MANQNIRTPRFYTDLISYHRARGSAIGSVTATDGATYFTGLQSQNTVADLLDLRPLNTVEFLTARDTDSHVLCNFTFSTANYKQNYIAILNHNLATAVGKIRIFAGDESSDVTALDGANADTADINWGSVTVTDIVNGDTRTAASNNKSVVIEPATDGTTIITFNEQDLRYWAIQFEGNTTNTGNATNGTWGSTNLTVAGIMIGEYFDMSQAPDLSLKRSVAYDKVKIQESIGGQRYAIANSFGRTASSTSKSPFTLADNSQEVYGGRISYDMNFSYLSSDNIFPSETTLFQYGDDTVISDVWNLADGPSRPFILSIDKDSAGNNAESEHLFARFAQNSLSMQQVSPDVYNIGLRIEEEF
tara:strand:- start:238 stop:1320 length:1083 start_codon:yes stop_codon:yes gene_type:complete